jgi:hypothetical protein
MATCGDIDGKGAACEWWGSVLCHGMQTDDGVCTACGVERHRRAPVCQPVADLLECRRELEQARVHLAGCGVAALGGTTDPAKRGDYGWSPAYQDVLYLRLKYDQCRRERDTERQNADTARLATASEIERSVELEKEIRELRRERDEAMELAECRSRSHLADFDSYRYQSRRLAESQARIASLEKLNKSLEETQSDRLHWRDKRIEELEEQVRVEQDLNVAWQNRATNAKAELDKAKERIAELEKFITNEDEQSGAELDSIKAERDRLRDEMNIHKREVSRLVRVVIERNAQVYRLREWAAEQPCENGHTEVQRGRGYGDTLKEKCDCETDGIEPMCVPCESRAALHDGGDDDGHGP